MRRKRIGLSERWRFNVFGCAGLLAVLMMGDVEARAGEPVTVVDVSDLLRAEVSEDLIRVKLEQDGCLCDTSAQSITELDAAGASEELIVDLIGFWRSESEVREPMSIPDAVMMLGSGLAEHIVYAKLQADGCRCDTSAQSIIDLKSVGASDEFVVTLIRYENEIEP